MAQNREPGTAVHSAGKDEGIVPHEDAPESPGQRRLVGESGVSPMPLWRAIILVLVLASSSFLNVRFPRLTPCPERLTNTVLQTSITQACVIVLPSIGRDLEIPLGRQ